MTQKWNLQDIRPAEPRRRTPVTRPIDQPRPVERGGTMDLSVPPDDSETIDVRDGNKESKKKYILLSSIVAFLIISVFGLSAMLSKTTLPVYPEFTSSCSLYCHRVHQ